MKFEEIILEKNYSYKYNIVIKTTNLCGLSVKACVCVCVVKGCVWSKGVVAKGCVWSKGECGPVVLWMISEIISGCPQFKTDQHASLTTGYLE